MLYADFLKFSSNIVSKTFRKKDLFKIVENYVLPNGKNWNDTTFSYKKSIMSIILNLVQKFLLFKSDYIRSNLDLFNPIGTEGVSEAHS